jgi:CxxC-x17-CxxC domain-containing protein
MRENNRGPRRDFDRPRRDFRGPRRDFDGPKEMHKATCSECGQECEVPFKPTEGKPVFCKECYRKKKRF